MQSPVVHRAPRVLPIASPSLENGGVAVLENRITAVGRYSDMLKKFPAAAVVDHPDCVLLPGLVNAHIHLELSHLANLSQRQPPATFSGWIENMLAARDRAGEDEKHRAARLVLQQQHQDGIAVLADIGNTSLGRSLEADFPGVLLPFHEFLGLRETGVAAQLKLLDQKNEREYCSGHAPYSTHAALLCGLKARARRLGQVFPIHVAESEAEIVMISRGRGEFVEFLKQRSFWDGSFQATGIDNSGSVQYLQQLGLLDEKTLCVHCVHVSDREIELLQKTGARVCLCPGSNRYLGVGLAPVMKYLQAGIIPALGTDSLASNPRLSIWREMRLLAESHPGLAVSDILIMATLGGAAALGVEQQAGTLEPGRQARFLAVPLPDTVHSKADVVEYLVRTGTGIHPEWIYC